MENLEYLNREIITPLTKCIGLRLDKIVYSDFGSPDDLITNYNGVDIISYQANLKFEGNQQIFFSWNSVEIWDKYTIGVSGKIFFEIEPDQTFEPFTKYANDIIGKRLLSFKVFGYGRNEWKTYQEDGKKIKQLFLNQPHLIVLNFEGCILGIANFYREDDFEPKLPMGDDVWVIFTEAFINKFIKDLSLEELFSHSI